jgi:hypothetical protein
MSAVNLTTVLYRQLPEVYRSRDNPRRKPDGSIAAPGDLVRLLDTFGDLQGALYRTVLQRYYDIFPDQEGVDDEGLRRGCQPWVLPYLAQLLDVVPLSPLESGQRTELADAVAWRQRKGTTAVAERIAEAVAGLEVELQEGWRMVAVTPHAGFALLPAASFGENELAFDGTVSAATPGLGPARATHPGLPNGTVDLRRASRAVRSGPTDPTAQQTTFDGVDVMWRQAQRHGVPCFPGTFQDVSARTADVRTPDWRKGHVHPRRVVLHAAPFHGYFAPVASVQWADIRDAVLAGTALPADHPLELIAAAGGAVTVRARTEEIVKVRGIVNLTVDRRWRFERIWFDNEFGISAGRVQLNGCALRTFVSHVTGIGDAVLEARACLFKNLLAARGLVRLEYCTVLERLVAEALTASDCILMRLPRKDLSEADTDVPRSGCIRYSRLPGPLPDPAMADGMASTLRVVDINCTFDAPVFVADVFGEPGCGVLHPATPRTLRFGAEDGGEMGAYHELRYTLREQAVLDKMSGYLPVGIEPVLVPDASLLCAPPRVTS